MKYLPIVKSYGLTIKEGTARKKYNKILGCCLLSIKQFTGTNCQISYFITLVPLPKIDALYAVLNGSTVYSFSDCTSGYDHIALSPDAQQKSAFVATIVKSRFKKVPLGLAEAPAHLNS